MNAQSYVTQELIQKIHYNPLYGQDVIPKTWGIWRHASGGIVEESEYYYGSGMIGPYKFVEPYTWVSEYYSKKPTPPKSLLYKYLLELNSALACIFVNNTYVCRVFSDRLEYIEIAKPMQRDVRILDVPIEQFPVVNIGWVKTKVRCYSVPTLPWVLHMDITNNMAYMGGSSWLKIEGNPKFFTDIDFPLYKQLLEQRNAEGVYVDLSTGNPVFI